MDRHRDRGRVYRVHLAVSRKRTTPEEKEEIMPTEVFVLVGGVTLVFLLLGIFCRGGGKKP